jgi:hypothetical protein
VPVIIVSAMGHLLQGLQRKDARATGVVEVLAKPVGYTKLIEAEPGDRPTQSGGLTPDPRLGTIGCRGHDSRDPETQIGARRA